MGHSVARAARPGMRSFSGEGRVAAERGGITRIVRLLLIPSMPKLTARVRRSRGGHHQARHSRGNRCAPRSAAAALPDPCPRPPGRDDALRVPGPAGSQAQQRHRADRCAPRPGCAARCARRDRGARARTARSPSPAAALKQPRPGASPNSGGARRIHRHAPVPAVIPRSPSWVVSVEPKISSAGSAPLPGWGTSLDQSYSPDRSVSVR